MANRYWVGGSGTWNTTSTTNWATSSGGSAGASAPTAADDVFFDANSNVGTGAFTVTVSAAVCRNFNAGSPTALDGAMTLALGTSTLTVSGSWTNPATNFSITNGSTAGQITFNATTAVTLTTNNITLNCTINFNGSGGTWTLGGNTTSASDRTTSLVQGTLDLNNFTFTVGIFSSNNTNVRSIAFGTTGRIVLAFSGAPTTNLSMATATNFTFTGTSNISAAMNASRTFNFGGTAGATDSNRPNLNITGGNQLVTLTGSFRQINFTGSTPSLGPQIVNCHGFTLAFAGTFTSATFNMVGSGTLTYNGRSISTLNILTPGITSTLASAGQNATTTLTNGTLDLAGFTLTSTTTAATAAGTKNLTFNGGTLVCSAATTTAWNNANPTGFTTTAGAGTGTISMTSPAAKTFVGGGSTYNCTLRQGGVGTLTITGANTFNDITRTSATASQITFPASTTTTVNNFTLSGTAGNLVSIRSSAPGTQFTLSKNSGTVSVSYLNIQDSNATGGATWNAYLGNGNVDSGNNTGWNFNSGAFIAFFSP